MAWYLIWNALCILGLYTHVTTKGPWFDPWVDQGAFSVRSLHALSVPHGFLLDTKVSSDSPQTCGLGWLAALNCPWVWVWMVGGKTGDIAYTVIGHPSRRTNKLSTVYWRCCNHMAMTLARLERKRDTHSSMPYVDASQILGVKHKVEAWWGKGI